MTRTTVIKTTMTRIILKMTVTFMTTITMMNMNTNNSIYNYTNKKHPKHPDLDQLYLSTILLLTPTTLNIPNNFEIDTETETENTLLI